MECADCSEGADVELTWFYLQQSAGEEEHKTVMGGDGTTQVKCKRLREGL